MQTPLLWSAFGLLTFFPYVHLQNLTLRPYNLLYESRKLAFQDGFWSRFFKFAIINLKLLLFRYEQERLTILKIHARESAITSVSSITEFLNANEPDSLSETATVSVKQIL